MRRHGWLRTVESGTIPGPDPSAPEPGLCWFGLQRLPDLMDAFAREIDGVRAAEDIEYIHRMRVATRRLRAALPLFRTCFSAKQYSRWMEEISNITRALGNARDADVQIAFLMKYQKRSRSAQKKISAPGEQIPENPYDPALIYLLDDLRKRRSQFQVSVLTALAALEKSGAIGAMQDIFATRKSAARKIPWRAMSYGIPTVAALRIETRLVTMLSYEPWVPYPEAVAEHHATRIAAKKLRYTMEIYGPVYRLNLKKPLLRVKKIQEILGDLHDCDVWIDHVTRIMLRERSHLRTENEEKRPDTATLASLRLFLRERERARTLLHRQFVRYWEYQKRTHIWDELQHSLLYSRKKKFQPPQSVKVNDVRSAVGFVAAQFPEGLAHHRHVTHLSLMLFDGLQPIHGLTRHDRFLLECAGMLHDIGWMIRQKRHNRLSAARIFADETIPLDIGDRITVGLISHAHSGQATPETHVLFPLLREEQQKTCLKLAALLRVADGLDYLHLGSVLEIHCIIGSGEVICDVVSPGDVVKEKERARSKAGLFSRAFGRELVIR
jgi:CHAD domain-containing protein